jgi:L-amino acid N-acyltransferase YncA
MIRTARAGDAHEIADIYRPYVVDSFISFEENPPNAAEMLSRLEAGLARYPWLVSVGANGIEGFAYASAHRAREAYRWSVDVTVYVRTGLAGRGVGHALYATLLSLLGRQGFRTAFAGIALPNPASVGLHEAIGFVPVGVYRAVGFKCGTWRDVGWWGKALVHADAALPEPIPFSVLADKP